VIDQYKYWNTFPGQIDESDFLRQVGRTVNGKPISRSSINLIVKDILFKLDIKITDCLLDLCCGNGLITAQLASHCNHITGVDFSAQLIRIANRHFVRENIIYETADVRELPDKLRRFPFTKILMNACIQHFEVNETRLVFESLQNSASSGAPILLTSIPDKLRLWDFYNTPERRAEYHLRIKDNTEAIGTWWTQQEFSALATSFGYTTQFFQQSSDLDTAHYRFDVLLNASS